MKKFYVLMLAVVAATAGVFAQQLPDPHFEDWSDSFKDQPQLKNWHGSNVEQLGFKFVFMEKATGRSGSAAYVEDKEIGALGITEVGPGYMGLGTAWQYLEGASTGSATAGTVGGISWKYRPDTMAIWIKRTGSNTDKEDFHLMYYAWNGTAQSSKYKCKNGGCTSTSRTNEESDVRQALDGNECGTDTKANQIAEGWYRARAKYDSWTQIKVPIYYMNSEVPTMCNVILSAGNYPNFRANSGLYKGNGLYVDDIELIYSSKIQKLYIDDKEWKGFDPDSEEEQTYSLGEKATTLPSIEAWRGEGKLTNVRGTTVSFNGRKLSGSEISISNGVIDGKATTITVKSEDGKSTHVYKIKFVRAASTNANLAGININGEALPGFKGTTTSYNVELPYGTSKAPVVDAVKAEDQQTVSISQASSPTGTATITVTAADKKTTKKYTLTFSVAQLKDNTLKNILVNGEGVAGFVPNQTIYKVSLPIGTTAMPTVKAVSAYPDGAQTIKYTAPDKIDGGTYQISVTSPGNQTPKVYKLNFKLEASTYSKLKDLKMGDYITDFDPDVLTYYVHLPIGTTQLPEITYVKGDPYQKSVEIQEGGLDGTTRVIVTAANGDQTIYKIIVTTEKSSKSTLNNIFVGGVALPDFAPNTYKYTYNLEVGTTSVPTITVTPGDEYQTYTINYGGVNETTRVTVTAGDGSTTVYQIAFVVAKSENMSLENILVDGKSLEGFSPDVLEYYYTVAKGAAVPTVTAVKGDPTQTVNERKITSVPGDYKLTVVAESGAKQTYVIHFVLNLSANANLSAILFDGVAMEGFKEDTYEYEITLPVGQSTLPEVSWKTGDNGQKVIPVENDNTCSLQVTAENGYTVNTYTIQFILQQSTNAYLKMIYLDGNQLAGFDSTKLVYDVTLQGAQVPVITYEKADQGQQVTVAAPVGIGTASLLVAPETGSTNTYLIHFLKASSDAVQLEWLKVDGQTIAEWSPETYNYIWHYSGNLPVVTYGAKTGQQIQVIEQSQEVSIYVTAGGENAQYKVSFIEDKSEETALNGIYLNGVLVDEWAENTLEYSKTLAAGEQEPVITWQTKHDAQVVVFGQKAENQYQIAVKAGTQTRIYTVTLNHTPFADASLVAIQLDGEEVINRFNKKLIYPDRPIKDGDPLPVITYTKRPGQTVLVGNTSATEQQIIVVAEDGNSLTYTIRYKVQKGTDATLSGILLDGVAMADFEPTRTAYTHYLPQRTLVVPSVTPLSHISGQTYTIAYGRVNARTYIEVLAKDGETKQVYEIEFKVLPQTNTDLAELELTGGVQLMKDPNVTEYTRTLTNYEEGVPEVFFKKAEPEQKVVYTRGRGGETWVKVIAQSGETKTYHVQFVTKAPTKVNNLRYVYINGGNRITAQDRDTILVNLPYGTTEMNVTYTKQYNSQSVIINNGGVTRPTELVVCANYPGIEDKKYVIVPSVATNNPAVFKKVTVFGKSITIDPQVFNYVVNVTAENKTYSVTKADSVTYEVVQAFDDKTKSLKLKAKCGEYENIYTFSYYYTNCEPPFDFSGNWVQNGKKTGYKPSAAWKVPGDYTAGYDWNNFGVNLTYTSGKEVSQGGNNGAMLSTLRGASMNGSLPGMMTLGSMTVSLGSEGSSTSSVSCTATDGITFRNTPEQLVFEARPLSRLNVDKWYGWLTMSDGKNMSKTDFGKNYPAELNVLEPQVIDIKYDQTPGAVSKMNIFFNSCHTENAGDMGYGWLASDAKIHTSDLIIQNLHFVYNSKIASLTVDDANNHATINGTNITYHIDDAEYAKFPEIRVVGEVHDQQQEFTWKDEVLDGENMVREALLRNYGEDHSYTDYTLKITRPAVTETSLSVIWAGEALKPVGKEFTVYRTSMLDTIPNVEIVPGSVHQQVKMRHEGDRLLIDVTPELGEKVTYVVNYVEVDNNDATLASISGGTLTPAFDAKVSRYEVNAKTMPVLQFAKKNHYQSVEMIHTADSVQFIVTAADKTSQNRYSVVLATEQTSAQIETFKFDGEQRLAADRMEIKALPVVALFERKDATDSIAQVITEDSIVWNVYGTFDAQHKYVLVDTTNASSEVRLQAVLVNGKEAEQFDNEPETIIPVDSVVTMQIVPFSAEQTISIAVSNKANMVRRAAGNQHITFTVTVTAADGKTTATYVLKLEQPKSSDASLKAIVVGTDTIMTQSGVTKYTYTVPISVPKVNEPKMPEIAYIPADKAATVKVEPDVLNATTYINVIPADGSTEIQYELLVESAKSTNTQLNGIVVDGTPIADFDPARFYYSVQVANAAQHSVVCSAEDKFQSIHQEIQDGKMMITVTAEDNAHSQLYIVDLYEMNKSNVTTLKGILVDGKPLDGFDPGQNTYTINLSAIATIAPDVQAVMMVAGQSVVVRKDGWTIYLDVTAEDKEHKNTYTVHFDRPMSDDVTLKMIMLDGDSIQVFDPKAQAFDPAKLIYQINLPVGKHELPTIYAQRNINVQKMPEIVVDSLTAEVHVTAQNGKKGVYTLLFSNTYSDADSLLAIYGDNQLIEGFEPRQFYYSLTLPVEAAGFPELTWEQADDWQRVRLDTLEMDSLKMMCQIEVTAENEHKNVYTISYERELWAVDTLQMIYVDNKPLEGFSSKQLDYSVILPAGTTELPLVSYDTNEKFKQHISILESVDSIATKSLNKKVDVVVMAENGKTRTYTIHFPVELSDEAGLNIIQYGGQTISGFDSERTNYKVFLPIGTHDVPVITVGKKEEVQKVDINTNDWTVTIDVTAEDGVTTRQYVIEFELAKSDVTLLQQLICIFPDHQDSIAVMPDIFEYAVALPIGVDTLPNVDVVKGDSLQTVQIIPAQIMPDSTYLSSIIVTAPDEETQAEYQLIFSFSKNNDASLLMIYLDTMELEGFHKDSMEYHIAFPSGTDSTQYYTPERVSVKLSDPLAKDSIWQDEELVLYIDVTAQDGSRNTYSIRQSTALSDDNLLADILLDSVSFRDFDPEVTFYTYYVQEGNAAPEVTAVSHDPKAEISIKPGEALGDTTRIMCTAENGDTRVYQILFATSKIDDAQTPTPQDVLVKRIFGTTQIFVASLRINVAFALYDRAGHLVEYIQKIPTCDPNDAIIDVNANGVEFLQDVVDEQSGAIITLEPNTLYFYSFFENEKRRITSGKMVIVAPGEKVK